jgi:hypothetical protein
VFATLEMYYYWFVADLGRMAEVSAVEIISLEGYCKLFILIIDEWMDGWMDRSID